MNLTARQVLKAEFLAQVSEGFPTDFMTQSHSECEEWGQDWTQVFPVHVSAVVFPRSTEEVAKFLKLCSKHRVTVVPVGGRTGLSGGCVATQGEVVLSLHKMNRMDTVDTLAHTVRVQAGAITEKVHQECEAHGLTWPVDFASKGSSQVGGNIATNAGGVKVIRYGSTRNWVLGLQVVTMQGQILEMNGALEKNNTGLDLRQLFMGSEGTLGVITEATLKLCRIPGEHDVFFFAVEDVTAVLRLFHEVRRSSWELMAFEFLTQNCLNVVVKMRDLKHPFPGFSAAPSSCYVLLEITRPLSSDARSLLDQWLVMLFDKGLVQEGVLAQNSAEAKALWALREGVSESLMRKAFVHKNDIALPISRLEEFLSGIPPHPPDFELFLFGHIGDGNIHVNTMKPDTLEKGRFIEMCEEWDVKLYARIQHYGGSISAEHGIGLLKKAALQFSKSPAELEYMKAMKRIFDPSGLLNPGKIFD